MSRYTRMRPTGQDIADATLDNRPSTWYDSHMLQHAQKDPEFDAKLTKALQIRWAHLLDASTEADCTQGRAEDLRES